MAVSFEVPLMHVNSSDCRLRNPQILPPGLSTNKNVSVYLNILKAYAVYSNNKRERNMQNCSLK